MIFKANDGKTFEADDAEELVEQLHQDSFAPASSDQEWMKQTAERTVTQTGQPIRSDTAQHFVDDLLEQGLMTITKEKDNAETSRYKD
jgi:hypothetical protein